MLQPPVTVCYQLFKSVSILPMLPAVTYVLLAEENTQACQGNARLPMVVTTCLSLDEIETRISSRMVDFRTSLVFNITAPDYRGNVKPTRQAKRY
ncbi:MAG: hypothetical protein WB564_01670 [Dehalococcoidia bacterium]